MSGENMKRWLVILLTLLLECSLLSCGKGIALVDLQELGIKDSSLQTDGSEESLHEWKNAYLEFIENRESESEFDYLYALAFVDNDNVPELYAMGTCEAEGDLVCSYKNGCLIKQPLLRNCGGQYIERSGIVINQNGHMGYYYDNVYRLDENGFSQILNASYTESYILLGNDEYKIVTEYFIDDKPVNEDEYHTIVNAAIDLSQTVRFSENAVSYDAIKQKIADCK